MQSSLPAHRISVLFYMHYNQTWDGYINYSPIHMIKWSGYKPNRHRGTQNNIYTKFKDCMQWFYDNNYICNFDKELFIQNTLQSSLLNFEKLLPNTNFGVVYDFELNAIMNYVSSYKPLNKSILLLVLSYVRAFTWYRAFQLTGHSESSKKSKPEIFHSQFTVMSNFIGVNEKLISKATSILDELGIIKTYRMPNYQDHEGTWHTDDIIYVSPYKIISVNKKMIVCSKDDYDYKKELQNGISYLREAKYTSKKFYQD